MALNTGRILRVNLSSGKISTESIPESIATDFIGGRGYGIKYLYDEIKPYLKNEKSYDDKIIPPIIGIIATRKSGIKSYHEIFFSTNLFEFPFL